MSKWTQLPQELVECVAVYLRGAEARRFCLAVFGRRRARAYRYLCVDNYTDVCALPNPRAGLRILQRKRAYAPSATELYRLFEQNLLVANIEAGELRKLIMALCTLGEDLSVIPDACFDYLEDFDIDVLLDRRCYQILKRIDPERLREFFMNITNYEFMNLLCSPLSADFIKKIVPSSAYENYEDGSEHDHRGEGAKLSAICGRNSENIRGVWDCEHLLNIGGAEQLARVLPNISSEALLTPRARSYLRERRLAAPTRSEKYIEAVANYDIEALRCMGSADDKSCSDWLRRLGVPSFCEELHKECVRIIGGPPEDYPRRTGVKEAARYIRENSTWWEGHPSYDRARAAYPDFWVKPAQIYINKNLWWSFDELYSASEDPWYFDDIKILADALSGDYLRVHELTEGLVLAAIVATYEKQYVFERIWRCLGGQKSVIDIVADELDVTNLKVYKRGCVYVCESPRVFFQITTHPRPKKKDLKPDARVGSDQVRDS